MPPPKWALDDKAIPNPSQDATSFYTGPSGDNPYPPTNAGMELLRRAVAAGAVRAPSRPNLTSLAGAYRNIMLSRNDSLLEPEVPQIVGGMNFGRLKFIDNPDWLIEEYRLKKRLRDLSDSLGSSGYYDLEGYPRRRGGMVSFDPNGNSLIPTDDYWYSGVR